MIYLWVKALHIIFVIALMGGLLIYPRYKIHQLKSTPGEPLFETMKDASNRLRTIILNPSLVLVWVLGLAMIGLNPALLEYGWLHTKIVLVLALSGLHGYFIMLGKQVDRGGSAVSPKRLKMLNELPFVLTIFIVILVVVKPF